MTNALIRAGTREYVDPVEYVPYRASYTYWEHRSGYRPVFPTPGTTWGYDPETGLVNAFSSPGTWLEYFEYDVPITVPEQLEVPGFDGGWVDVPPAGWTSFAFSVTTLPGSGNATFKVPPWVRGAAVGLTSTPVTTGAGYGHIPHGLRFTDGHAYSISTGTDLGAAADSDVWGVTATGVDVLLKKNGSTVATEATTLPNTALFLAAVLVSVGDTVDEPAMDSIFTGTADMEMSLSMYGVAGAHAQALMITPAFTVTGESYNVPEIRLAMFAAESTAGYAAMVFPAVTLAASSTPLPVAPPVVMLTMPPIVLTAYMLTGEVASAAMALPTMSMVAFDYDYAAAAMTFPPITMSAWDEPSGYAYAIELMTAGGDSTATTTVLAVAISGIQIASTIVPAALLDALAQSTAGVHDTVLTRQLLDAIAFSFANVGPTAVIPGLGNVTWAWNPMADGSTTYSNYGFNSYARVGDRYFGANENGVFELDGDTDNGALIRASVNLGKLNFGTSVKKTVQQVYLGMSAAGNVFVKLTAEGQSYVYKTRDFNAELQQQRVTPGKGLRTSYVELELYNENGGDFEVDTVEFVVADMTRKI